MNFSKLTLSKFGFIPILIILFSFLTINAQQLAFPTAKGAGAYTTGGRGGQVIHVTTLDWSAPGGLREAIQTPGPRIIVFDVSGEIDATSEWEYTPIISGEAYNDITIAGQTAPAGGISIRTSEFMFQNVSNVIIRYVRFRSDIDQLQDAFWLTGGSNIIIDHCTFSHGGDESASLGSSVGQMGNITMQNCFLQDSKTGTILGVDDTDGDFTFVNNVYSSISHRFPNPKGDGQYDIINNIVYNWKYRLVRITGEGTYNVVNNYYKGSAGGIRQQGWFRGVDITPRFMQKLQTQPNDNPLIYAAGSIVVEQRETPQADDRDMWSIFAGSHLTENAPVPAQYFTNTQFPLVGHNYPIKPANQLYIDLLNDVGADKTLNANGSINAYRDTKDAADILMIQNDTYNLDFFGDRDLIPYAVVPQNTRPDGFDSNNDGMPDVWKIARGFSADADLSSYLWSSGYVGIEEYLNSIDLNNVELVDVSGVEVTPETGTINIPETIQLSATIVPQESSNQGGVWASNDETIATVNSNGIVTPISEGVVNIFFTTNDGDFVDEATITVTDIVIDLEDVIVSPGTDTIELGGDQQLSIEFLPSDTSDTTGIWTSSDESVAIVDEDGNVSTVGEGETEILFTANDNGISDSAIITVVDNFYGTYILYNADSDEIIQNIEGDENINLEDQSSQINFRSIPEGGDQNPEVESVGISWTGPSNGTWIESDPIYAGLPNGHVGLNFEAYTVTEGTYNFTITYFSANSGGGNVVAVDNFSLTIFFDSLPVANAGLDQVICEGETITLTASGGTNFLWSNGETTASIEVNPIETETYTVTVSDDEGNTDEDSVIVTVNELPIANIGEDQTICEGESLLLTASGGTSFLWNTGETTETIEVNPEIETIYSVEVTSNNCTSTDEITVFVNEAPAISVSGTIVIVEGETTTLIASGGDNYEWSTGEITESITVSPIETQTYTLSSASINSCVSTIEVIVTVIPEIIANAGDDFTICGGETVTLIASGGSTYTWNTGEVGSELIVNPTTTTTYTVTAEDDYGYTDTDTVTVFVNELPSVVIDTDNLFIMIGNSAILTANGGNSYLWSTGEATGEISVSPDVTTTYSVTGISEDGCENTIEITITVIEMLSANAGDDATICLGESITLNASGGIGYLWNTGDTGAFPTFTPTETTTYTVTINDDYGNIDTDEVTITVNPIPTAYAGEDQTICNGDTVTLLAEGGDSYLWNTGATTASISVNPSEDTIYSVEVINNNCSDTDDVNVVVLPLPEITITDDIVLIIGNSATLEVSGGDSYLWNTGDTSDSLIVNPLETTTYSVTSSLINGCQSTSQVTVTVIPVVVADAGSDFTICNGDSATLTASGGLSYIWSTGDTSANAIISPTETTTYTVTATDAYGNSNSDNVTVTVNELPNLTVSENVTIYEGESTNLTASGSETYLWNTGETSSDINVSPVETTVYSVTGLSTNGCEAVAQIIVTVIPEVIANAGNDVSLCVGDFLILSATGGSTYSWNTGQTSSSLEVSPTVTTTYTVTATDAFGNSDTDSVTVTVNSLPIVSLVDEITILEGDSTPITASGAASYLWETGETTSSITVSPTASRTYSVTGFSVNGCETTEEVLVVVVSVVIADAGADVVICEGESTTLNASGSSYYLWSTGETSSSITVNPSETTTYNVTVTDDYGNLDSDSVTVTVTDMSSITLSEDVTIFIGESTTLTVIGAESYIWNTGDTADSIIVNPLETTTFSVVSLTANGCQFTHEVTVTVEIPEINANAGNDVTICNGESVTLNASGGDNYVWNTGGTGASPTFTPTETTTYTVTVSDNFGNSDTDSVTVTVNVIPNLTVSENITIFYGETANLTANGTETYLWSNGATTNSITVSPTETTTYTVNGYSVTGCESEQAQVTVTVIPNLVANAGNDVTICNGESVTLNASGGDNYVWNTGGTGASPTFTPTETTTYTVTVSDNFGNSDTDSVTVTVNEIPNIIVSENITIYYGESTNISAIGAESYLWSNGATTSSITLSPIETTTYTVNGYSVAGCESEPRQVTVTVIPNIVANAGNDVAICNGESVTLNASGGDNYVWNTGGTGASPTITPTETTTYTVTVSDNFGNSDTDSVTVTVNEIPNITVSENITIYYGESTNISAIGAESYLWSNEATTSSITISPTETTTYTVIGYSVAGCESEPGQVTVSVIPEVIANAGNDVSICLGDSVTLNASGGNNYVWNTGGTGATPTFTPTVTTTYTVTVSDNFGNSDTDSVTVTVNEIPNLTVTENSTIYFGESIDLVANGAATYLWNNGEITNSITVSPIETTTYNVNGFSDSGCSISVEVTITVLPEVIANAGNDVTICIGESVTLNASGGDNYSWSTGQNNPTITLTPTETTTYTVTVSDNFGNSDTDSVIVTVNELPIIAVSEDITIIEGESTNLIASGADMYLWNTGESFNSISVSPTETTTYIVTGTVSSCSAQAAVTVTVTPLFVASAGADEYVCDNLNYEVELTANQGDSYLWSTGATTQSIIVSPLSTTNYSVTVTQGEQVDSDDVTVYVNPSPDVVILNGESVDILNGDFITLTASGANNYEWSNGALQPNIAVSPSTTTTYEVRGFIGDCYDDRQITVNVLQAVVANAGEDVTMCLEETVTLTATGGDEYVWSTGEITPTIEVSPLVTTDYTVTVFNALDFDEATVRVEVDANCTDQIDNPIDDLSNFAFHVYPNPANNIINIKLSGSTFVTTIYIFDVTGKLIQQTKISNEDLGLTSTTQIDISTLNSGVYFVKLSDEERDVTKKLIVN